MEVKSGEDEIVKSVLRCSFCSHVYVDPTVLTCLHTFCKSCIAGLEKSNSGGSIMCPVCKMSAMLPAAGIDGFRKNLYIARLTEMFPCKTVGKSCTVCELNGKLVSSVYQCFDCLDFLCQSCSKGHSSSTITAKHRVVSRSEILSGKYDALILEKQTILCDKHKEEVQMYCKSCKCLACIQCVIAQHMDHVTSAISLAADSAKHSLQNIIKETTTRLSTLKRKSDSLITMQKTRQYSQNQKINEINKEVDKIISKVKRQGEDIIEQINNHCATQDQQYSLVSSAIKSQLTSARDTVAMCHHALSKGSDVDAVLLSDTLDGNLDTVRESDKRLDLQTLDTTVNLKLQTRSPNWKFFTLKHPTDPLTNVDKPSRTKTENENKLLDSGTDSVSTDGVPTKKPDLHVALLNELQSNPSSGKPPVNEIYVPKAFYMGNKTKVTNSNTTMKQKCVNREENVTGRVKQKVVTEKSRRASKTTSVSTSRPNEMVYFVDSWNAFLEDRGNRIKNKLVDTITDNYSDILLCIVLLVWCYFAICYVSLG